jgi:hypothetical protein
MEERRQESPRKHCHRPEMRLEEMGVAMLRREKTQVGRGMGSTVICAHQTARVSLSQAARRLKKGGRREISVRVEFSLRC